VPGSDVPDNSQRGSDAAWRTWIKDDFNSVSHPIGTCAMMKRSLGGRYLVNVSRTLNLTFPSTGVVDSQLRIYDTTNIRIVDASIMPLQVSAHLSSTLYGIAEKAADLIKASQ
jgi:choline dehydrogenase